MNLPSDGRDYYFIDVEIAPPLDGPREASFDDGENWHVGTEQDGGWAWLVAGPTFVASEVGMDAEDTIATISETLHPRIRAMEAPVVTERPGPIIRIVE